MNKYLGIFDKYIYRFNNRPPAAALGNEDLVQRKTQQDFESDGVFSDYFFLTDALSQISEP